MRFFYRKFEGLHFVDKENILKRVNLKLIALTFWYYMKRTESFDKVLSTPIFVQLNTEKPTRDCSTLNGHTSGKRFSIFLR